jgi:16S rRNA (uracil1498-N3)-methyltransferase
MHRFFAPESRAGSVVRLTEPEARHALRVLRLETGAPVVLLDGEGGEHDGVLEAESRQNASVRITARRQHPPPTSPVTLIQAIAKGPAMEGLIHRAVELGCRRLVPLISERSVSRPDAAGDKQAKWQSIAIEAAKQSGNPWLLEVTAPQTPAQWLRNPASPLELLLVASLADVPRPLHEHLAEASAALGRAPRSVGLLIGPEGDFSPAEYQLFRTAGARPFRLGPYVLRVETAATAALAILQNLLREKF